MFDARLQFFILLFYGSLAIFASSKGIVILTLMAIGLLVMQGYFLLSIKWLLFYAGLLIIHICLLNIPVEVGLLNILLLLTFIVIKILPTLIVASSLAQMPISRLLASLQKCYLPYAILLTFTVAIRFFPILQTESKMIQENAYIRNISIKQINNWLHLTTMFEYAIIPLLMRTIRLADDLSASATVRGVNIPIKKTSRHPIQLKKKDILLILLNSGMVITLL